jgi:hypothetical protein|tara:strand:- start:366 stop:767 length:402 start_codon:yes stop_codon:yes gene_type:complete
MFQYCIWLLPENNSILYSLTNGFPPHISLHTHLSLSECKKIFNTMEKKKINIKILKKNETTEYKRFHYYYHFVYKKKILPEYPHISFIYDDKPILREHIEKVYHSIDFSQTYVFDQYQIMCCQQKDYKKWYKI